MPLTRTILQEPIMTKKIFLSLMLLLNLNATEIPTEHTQNRAFGKSVDLNAQIIQLSNASQSIMSSVGGHIEEYFVKVGQHIKKDQKIVLLESIVISKMTANYISVKKQLHAQQKNYAASKSLYEKGMTSMQELNTQSIKKDELLATLTALKSQLSTLGIQTSKLKKATSSFVLYAHSDGVVSAILQPLHASVKEDTPIISVVKNQAFYLKSYLSLEYAQKVRIGQKIVIQSGDATIVSHVSQILPKVDEETQRIILLSSIDEKVENLYINAYVSVTLYFDATKKYVAVKKSALSFFNNEWVVFTPEEHEGHDEHQGELSSAQERDHLGGDEHDEDEEEASYEIHVIKIITQDEAYVAVEGLELDVEYVSDKSYYVKSQLLKSSLGGHGH